MLWHPQRAKLAAVTVAMPTEVSAARRNVESAGAEVGHRREALVVVVIVIGAVAIRLNPERKRRLAAGLMMTRSCGGSGLKTRTPSSRVTVAP